MVLYSSVADSIDDFSFDYITADGGSTSTGVVVTLIADPTNSVQVEFYNWFNDGPPGMTAADFIFLA